MFLATPGHPEDVAHEILMVHFCGFERHPPLAHNIDEGESCRRAIWSPGLDFKDDVGSAFVEVFERDVRCSRRTGGPSHTASS